MKTYELVRVASFPAKTMTMSRNLSRRPFYSRAAEGLATDKQTERMYR